MSVFLSPPVFSVLHGRQELGFVDELTFLGKQDGPRVLLLGGRAWRVNHVDWSRKTAYVEPSEDKGRSRWKGAGTGLGFSLCQSIKQLLATNEIPECWSRRAQDQMATARDKFAWLAPTGSVVVTESDGEPQWWNFGGYAANACMAPALSSASQSQVTFDSFSLQFEPHVPLAQIEDAIQGLRSRELPDLLPNMEEAAVSGLKFCECLPEPLIRYVLQRRMQDSESVTHIVQEPVRFVSQ